MIDNTVRKFVVPLGLGVFMTWLAVFGLSAAGARSSEPQVPSAPAAIDRAQDPVVLLGADFPGFANVPLDELALYAHRSDVWTPIPFQIDEVSITGTYVISDGGVLDANDELVFMPGDAGDGVSAAIWPEDPQSRLHARYAISVTDPLRPADKAWVYLFRSHTLTRSGVSYVNWDESAQTATAVSYTAVFSPAAFLGLADLTINNTGVDILDRQKIRAEILLGLIKLNEESLAAVNPAPLALPAVGPVRAVTNDGDLNAGFYGSRMDIDVSFDLSGLGPFLPDFIRTSFDWRDPTVTGITTYYDSNTLGGVTIDGLADAVAMSPPVGWFQVSGGASGPGGMVVAVPSIDPAGGTLSNYYADDGAVDVNDTGDQQSFGDAGLRIDDPGAIISVTLVAYVLPSGTTATVGAIYYEWVNNPLIASAAEQRLSAHDLSITKDDGGRMATAGGLITYTLTGANNGTQNATGVVITETVPANTIVNLARSAGWGQVGLTNRYTFPVGSLAVGGRQTITFVVSVTRPLPSGVGIITNTARIGDDGAQGPDQNPLNNEAQISTAVMDFGPLDVTVFLPLLVKACACP